MRPFVIQSRAELAGLDLAALPARAEPQRVLMCTPEHFDVVDVKNPHMAGHIGHIDRPRAAAQWRELAATFRRLGHEVATIAGQPGLEDMVFAANQVLPGIGGDGRPYVVPSHMRHERRRGEVPHYRAWFAAQGYAIRELSADAGFFEGQGDAIWHPGRQLLWGGHGPRTSPRAYDELAALLRVPVIELRLVQPGYYHLDTCFCALSPAAALVYPAAFDGESLAMLRAVFPLVIEVPEGEASHGFACNALCLDGRTVVLQRGAVRTVAALRAAGFEVAEVETGEFLKSGGSVFCLKVMVY
ncbi:MAG: amidinotransferase [Planctomycetes bacterium]|nr:amidinotransferase [Planctomycetota bacterium]